ncbi:hypothetical protein FKM82_030819 [Ascaphus truei]
MDFSNVSLTLQNVTFLPTHLDNVTQTKVPGPPRQTNVCGDISSTIKTVQTFSIVIFSVAFLLGVVGNGLVIWITGFRMKKTVNTTWFLNLALADFIFTLFLPMTIVYTALGLHWPFGNFMCKFISSLSMLNMFASVFFLTVISVDRCVSVVFPVWAQNHRNTRLATIVAVITWTLALILCSPSLAFRDTFFNNRTKLTTCFNNYAFSLDSKDPYIQNVRQMRHKAMVITRFLVGFLIPFLIIVVCYGILITMLKKNRLVACSKKPLRVIIAVVVTFFLCWFPYHVFSLLELTYHARNNCSSFRAVLIGTSLATSLAFINSCVNPILYVFIGRNAQHRIRKSVLQVIESALKDEPTRASRSSRTQSKSTLETTTRFL